MERYTSRLYHVVVTVDHNWFDSPLAAQAAVEHAIECVGNEYGMAVSIIGSSYTPVNPDHVAELVEE